MSKLNISGIVKGIKAQTTYLTPIIEAVCNSIDSIGKRPNGSIEIIAITQVSDLDFEVEFIV